MRVKLVLVWMFLLSCQITFAQYESPYKEENSSVSVKPNFYLGLGTGIQYKNGLLGFSLAYRVTSSAIAELNFGLGSYGGKVGLSGVFNVKDKGAWCPTLGFSKAAGLQNFEMETEVIYMGATVKTTTPVNLGSIMTLTPGFQRQLLGKNGDRFILEFGYAIGLNTQTYEFAEKSATVNNTLVPTASLEFSSWQKDVFKILSPAGISLGLSYYFGFKPKN